MNIGENNGTNSFQGPSSVSTSLHLGTRLVDWCPAGWEPGVAWQWWLAGSAALLCGAGGPLQPSVPQVCWFAEMAEPVQSVVLLLFSSNSHPKFVQGPLWQKSLWCYGFFSVWLLPELFLCGAPGESGPHGSAWGSHLSRWKGAGAWGWRAEQQAAKLAQLYGKTTPRFLETAPRCFIAAGLSCCGGGSLLSWKGGAGGGSEPRQTWGKQGGIGGCSRTGQLLRCRSLSGERRGTRPTAVSSLASPTQDCLALLRQCLMRFLGLFYLVIEIVSN